MEQRKAIIGLMLISLAAISQSCTEEAGGFGSGEGRIAPSVALDTESVNSPSTTPKSRALVDGVTKDDLSLRIAKSDGSFQKTWDKVSDFDLKQTFSVGDYTIEAFYGNPAEEGFDKPSFSGSQDISVADGRTTQVALTATPANAMFTLDYSEAFTTYLQAYSAELVTANNNIAVSADETRPVYVAPGQVTLNVAATTPTGISANFKIATVTAEAGYNYIVHIDLNNGEVGNAAIVVTFDESLSQEEVVIDLTDQLLSAPEPTITAEGFDPATPVEFVAGLGTDAKPTMNIVAMAGLKSVAMHTNSESLVKQGWPADVELLNNRDEALVKLGLDAVGLWKQPDKMAVVHFADVLNHITAVADAPESTFTITVTDMYNRVCEPLTLIVKAESPALMLDMLDTYDPGENLRVSLAFNGTADHIRNNVAFEYMHSGSGMMRKLSVVDVEQSSRAMNNYIVTLTTPVLDTPLEIIASCGGVSSKCTVYFANFQVAGNDNDTYANHAYVTVAGNEGNTIDFGDAKFFVKGQDNVFNEVSAENKGEYFIVNGLTPGQPNKVRVAVGGQTSRSIILNAETEDQIPNGDLEVHGSGSNYNEQTFAGWGTNNPMTTAQGISQDYTRYSGTATTAGRNGSGVELRTCGWGSGNAIWISVARSTVKYIDAGLLHLGSSRQTRPSGFSGRSGSLSTDDLDCGIEFASRPMSLTFYYKYTSKNSADRGFAEIWVKDARGSYIIEPKSVELAAAADWTPVTIDLDYPFGSNKCGKLYVRFQSTNNSACLEKNDTNFTLKTASAFVASHLYIDDIELKYKK